MAKTLIEFKNAKIVIPQIWKQKVLFENINFKITNEDKIALVGPNGIGKTTFLWNLIGRYKNTEITKNSHLKIAMVAQIPYLSQETGETFLKFFAKVNQTSEQKVAKIIADFNLKPFLKIKWKNLSGGQKQILKIAFALTIDFDLLILDEFSSHLEIERQKEVITYLQKLHQIKPFALILVSHDLDEIMELTNSFISFNIKQLKIKAKFENKKQMRQELKQIFETYKRKKDEQALFK